MAGLKQRLVELLTRLDGVEARPSKVAGGTALFHRGKEVAHFHHDHEIDVRLTRPVIRAFGLAHPPRSSVHPARAASSHWIELRFSTPDEVDRIAVMVEQALAAAGHVGR